MLAPSILLSVPSRPLVHWGQGGHVRLQLESTLTAVMGVGLLGSTGLTQPTNQPGHSQGAHKKTQLSGWLLYLNPPALGPSPRGLEHQPPLAWALLPSSLVEARPQGCGLPDPALVSLSHELTWGGAFWLEKTSFCYSPLFGRVLAV